MALEKKQISEEKALLRMAGLCSRSEQCESDIRAKLIRLGVNSGSRDKILAYLKENRYLDNKRYSISFAQDKLRLGHWGPKKIYIALKMKRLPSDVVREAMESLERDQIEEALEKCAGTKARSLDLIAEGAEGYANRKKLFSYLISRGFNSADANRMVKVKKEEQLRNEEMG